MSSQTTHSGAGASIPVWFAAGSPVVYPPLRENRQVDVCVIGGGVAGLTTAYLLARTGASVAVIEAGAVGGGETSRTTAHLTAALDQGYTRIAELHGEEHARVAAESQMAAIERIQEIVARERIACDFERVEGYLFSVDPDAESGRRFLEREVEVTHAIGLRKTSLVSHVPIAGTQLGGALHYPNQAQFHPLKYMRGLAEAFVRLGGAIYGDTRVVDVDGSVPQTVITQHGHRVVADEVVVATNAPIGETARLHARQAPYRSYVVGFRIPAGAIPHVLLWDTGSPYHYVRVQQGAGPDGDDVLLVGGEDHKAGQAHDADERFARLDAWGRAHFPMVGEIVFHWSGQVLRSNDGLALLGRHPGEHEHRYVITGDCCNGITNATIGAMIVSNLIHGNPNPWSDTYAPDRIRLRAIPETAKENANVVEQYAAWLTPGEVSTVEQIAPGSGAVIRRGLQKIAVYKAPDGALTERSAVCTHRHCIVEWNEAERTWDCPCHGSRFDPSGRVVSGPAVEDLRRAE